MSVSYGAARVTVAKRSLTVQRSMTAIATSCWARTSSGLRGIVGGLDRPLVHPPRDDGAFQQVAAVLGEDHALARRPDLVARPPDPLEPAGDRGRALDLDDEVDRAHVDAELQAGRGDERREPPGLEVLLDGQPLLAGDAAVMGPDQVLAGELVQPLGEPFAQPPAVGEDDRAAVAPDELEDPRVDRRPDAVAPSRDVAGPPGWSSSGRTSPMADMSSTGTTTWRSSGLRAPASTIATSRPGPTPPRKRAIASSGRWVAESPMRCRAARPAARRRLQALEAERECAPRFVPAIAWTSSTMTCSTPRRISRAGWSAAGTAIRAW